MQKPLRFLLPRNLRRMIRPVAYRILSSPHGAKVKEIVNYAKKNNVDLFIETGTYLGDTVDSVIPYFRKIYSIELNEKLFNRASKLFRNDEKVEIIQGDSKIQLKKIMRQINKRAIFWLDAHYSGKGTARGKSDSPISSELETILNHKVKNHIILIDDARMFTGKGGYPKLKDLETEFKTRYPDKIFLVKNDIIRIH
jgi:hypothetical protein